MRRVLRVGGRSPGSVSPARQEEALLEWARYSGCLIDPGSALAGLMTGGQEHDLRFDEENKRVVKVTREGVFGLSPGVEIELRSSGKHQRVFKLWQATPYEYLERLRLQNLLVPDIVRLEGAVMDGDQLAVVTSQPQLEISAVDQKTIDEWFVGRGFAKVTDSGYYRELGNIAVFDAHDKNVVRSGGDLIPFDVIPCHPSESFKEFIRESIAGGEAMRVVKNASTRSRGE
ncbi:MAG: hypothetical protein ACLFRP_07015 [Puniceicoccaceae bacterium]